SQHPRPKGRRPGPEPLPYRHGVKAAGNMIFLGGQVAMDSDGNVLHKFDLAAQTRIAMQNIAAVLAEFGASMRDVVKINRWYVAGGTVEEWQTAAEIMASFFTEPGPAATGIPVPALAYEGLLVQIHVIPIVHSSPAPTPAAQP